MQIQLNTCLEKLAGDTGARLPGLELDPTLVRCVMINEIVPADPGDDFYSDRPQSPYAASVCSLFQGAGIPVQSVQDLLERGVYLTNAVKLPKTGHEVPPEWIKAHLPILKRELELFPNLEAIMLMGDVAKKAMNLISRQMTGKNVIPTGSTYKLRHNEYYLNSIRIFPSYIMTGQNLQIEKSKSAMIADDLQKLSQLLGWETK